MSDNHEKFADLLASVAAEPKDRPANSQRVADKRPVPPKPTKARAARAAVKVATVAATQDAREGRTQGTQLGTANSGLNGKHPCACQLAVDAETGKPIVAACGRDTWKTFAPGHDARLKGALIRHGLAGKLVKVRGAGDETEYSATDAAGGWGFREQVAAGVANPGSKLARKARRVAKEDPQVPQAVVAKVGRWEREGVLVTVNGTEFFRYTTKNGDTKDTAKFVLASS
jgi:hypothetical protein